MYISECLLVFVKAIGLALVRIINQSYRFICVLDKPEKGSVLVKNYLMCDKRI